MADKTTKEDYALFIRAAGASDKRRIFVPVALPRNSEVGVCDNGFFRRGEECFDLMATANKLLEDL